jgi:hypothetical protein
VVTLINGRFLAKPPSGVTLVARELTRALLAEITALPQRTRPRIDFAAPPGAALPLPEGFDPAAHQDWLRIVPGPRSVPQEQLLLPQVRGAERVLNFCNVAPVLASRLTVWIHDAQVFDSPDSYSPAFRLYAQSMMLAMRLRRADIATVSAHSKRRLVAHGFSPDQITVVLNGGDHLQQTPPDQGAPARHGLTAGAYAFMVGSRARHKNIPFAAEALLNHGPQDLTIAVAGLAQAGAYEGDGLAPHPRLRLLPRISDAEMRALMQGARFVMCPSLDEGFGLSAAEALWESTPLGLSDRAALPEVGGDAALYFDPENARAIGEIAQRLCVHDVQANLKAEAEIQKKRLTWQAAARTTLDRFLL